MVSCICITRNRLKLLKQSINMFNSQTFIDKELVIVYYSSDIETKEYLTSEDHDGFNIVEYNDYDEILRLGDLRNLAISKANGEYICVWDDDDIFHPDRITSQLSMLLNNSYKACTLKRIVKFSIDKGRIELTPYREEGWENTLLFKKDIEFKYSSLNSGEDTPLLMNLYNNKQVVSVDKPDLYIYVFHGKNTVSLDHFKSIGNTKIRRDILNTSKFLIDKYAKYSNYLL